MRIGSICLVNLFTVVGLNSVSAYNRDGIRSHTLTATTPKIRRLGIARLIVQQVL